MSDRAIVIDTPEGIETYTLMVMQARLELEVRGLRFRIATLPAVNRKLGTNFRRKAQAIHALEDLIEERMNVRRSDRSDG